MQTQRPLSKAEQYIADVLAGRIVTSKLVRLAIERHQRDLIEGPARGLKFNRKKAQRVIDFIERFILGTEGEFDGKPFLLEPWLQCQLWILYGWTWAATGYRRFKFAYNEIARGNLKSTLASALCIYELIAVGEPGANVYSAATDKGTAKLVFDTASLMIKKSPALRRRIKVGKSSVWIQGTRVSLPPVPLRQRTSSVCGLRRSLFQKAALAS